MEHLALLGGTPVHRSGWPQWPVSDEKDEQRLLSVFRSGNWWRHSYGQGVELAENAETSPSMVAQFQRKFAQAHGCRYGICAANGTVTLEIALRAAGVKPGDEVIVPAYTYVATASAVLTVGAIPIFVDIDPDTYNLDVERLAEAITSRTRAVIPVHFGGQPCPMDEINALAARQDLVVLEDAAHAHGAEYNGRRCGSLGKLGSFSFQLSKNMTAGEGGIITTNRPELAELCETLVWAGRKPGRPWYEHHILASNARLTELQGAILLGQLERLDEQNARRAANAAFLDRLLNEIEGIRPTVQLPSTTRSSRHLYMFRYDPQAFAGLPKQRFVAALQAEGVGAAFGGYPTPLYLNPMFVKRAFNGGAWTLDVGEHGRKLDYTRFTALCPVAERACASEAVWIPQTYLLAGEQDMRDIAAAIHKIQRHAASLKEN